MKILIKHSILLIIFALSIARSGAQDLIADIIVNPSLSSNTLLSFVIYIRNDNLEIVTTLSGTFPVIVNGAVLETDSVTIKKGVGSQTTSVNTTGDFMLSIQGFEGEKLITMNEQQPLFEVDGSLEGNTIWTSESDYLITDDLIIPEGTSLKIEKGSKIFLAEKVNIIVYGKLQIEGSADQPVTFGPMDETLVWGGIRLITPSDSAVFEYCFFVKGGGNEEYNFGHSESQPLLMVDEGTANLQHCYFLDNPGKALGGTSSKLVLNDCIVSRCDTGGEYQGCKVMITDSWYIDIPDGDGDIDDDDNDASYFYGISAEGPSEVKNCYFLTGEDDAIDHNGTNLTIENCWIDGFFHEGVAASAGHVVKVFNTLIRNCEQAIEAGYGSPQVVVDHCTLVNNEIGIRFGDSYNWGCEGQMLITNSILYANEDNIMNFDLLTQGPVEGAIDISYSITNDSEYDNNLGCLEGTPGFDEFYLLLPGSVGTGLANDGSNLGLLDPSMGIRDLSKTVGISISPNPFYEGFSLSFLQNVDEDLEVSIYDCLGKLWYSANFMEGNENDEKMYVHAATWPTGVYIAVIRAKGKIINTNTIIKFEN